jgi:hypothetical protein
MSTVNEKKEPFRTSPDAGGGIEAPATRPRRGKAAAILSPDEERELQALAEELGAAADRMAASFDRAIEAVRKALDPEREAALRRRYEAEFSGVGKAVRTGLF